MFLHLSSVLQKLLKLPIEQSCILCYTAREGGENMRQTKNQKDTKTADLNVAVEEQVKRKVKAMAADEGKTLPEMVNELLKFALSLQPEASARAGQ
jgi:hypothetical protein